MEVVLGLELVRPPDRHHRDVELVGDAGERVAGLDLVGPQQVAAVLDGRVDGDRLEQRAVSEERALIADGLAVGEQCRFGGRELREGLAGSCSGQCRVRRVAGSVARPAPPPTATRGSAPSPVGPPTGPAEPLPADADDRGDRARCRRRRPDDAIVAEPRQEAERRIGGVPPSSGASGGGGSGVDDAARPARPRAASGSGAATATAVASGSLRRVRVDRCRGLIAAGSAQASDDALDADRGVQQYGLLACGRSGGAGARADWDRAKTVRGRGIELGVSLRGRRPLTTGLRHRAER